MKHINKHIIISRTDNIGDVILTLPMAALIKQTFPECKVSFLARNYVRDVVERCPDVNYFISLDELQKLPRAKAVRKLAAYHADAIIHVFPNPYIASLACSAKIPLRIGTKRRLFHWWTCNQRVDFTRKNSILHEAQLNLALFRPLELPTYVGLDELHTLVHLNTSEKRSGKLARYVDANRFNLVFHPLTNGNTKEWPLENIIALIKLLPVERYNVIITGTQHERERLQPILTACPQVKDAVGAFTLSECIDLFGQVNMVIANSTGPLHIAAALGTPVLGLFPSEKGKDPGRWAPLGARVDYLVADECQSCREKISKTCRCMNTITVQNVNAAIERVATLCKFTDYQVLSV